MSKAPLRALASLGLLGVVACSVEASLGEPPTPSSEPVPSEHGSRLRCEPINFGVHSIPVQQSRVTTCLVEGEVVIRSIRLAHPNLRLTREDGGGDFRGPFVAKNSFRLRVDWTTETPQRIREHIVVESAHGQQSRVDVDAESVDNRRCSLRLEPNPLPFGAVEVGNHLTTRFALSNVGEAPCTVRGVRGTNPRFAASLSDAYPLELGPGQAMEGVGRFTPPAEEGLQQGEFLFFTEEGTTATLQTRGQSNAAVTELSVNPLNFGPRLAGCQHPSLRTVVARPLDEEPVLLRADLIQGSSTAFRLRSPNTTTASFDNPAHWEVAFTPVQPGKHHARLRISGSLASGERFVELWGEGTERLRVNETVEGPKYQLSVDPMPGSIDVWIDGQLHPPTGGGTRQWFVDFSVRSLVFATPPSPEAVIEVLYDQVCDPSSCGNGQVDAFEMCDDGNSVESDGCSSRCIVNHCGDGVIWTGEEACDDGNTINGDGCNFLCQLEACGNGIREPPELCDTASARSDLIPNACRTDCSLPRCGDSVVDDFETCDDGNTSSSDGCIECVRARCGDGFVRRDFEECDDGNNVDGDGCSSDCRLASYEISYEAVVPYVTAPRNAQTVDLSRPFNLPFGVPFLGSYIFAVDATQPGLIVFDGSVPTAINTPIPSASGPSGLWAWWWDDLDAPSQGLAWVTGPPGRRAFVLRMSGVGLPNSDVSVEADLYLFETGALAVHYGEVHGPTVPGIGSASTGWESPDGLRGAPALACSPNCKLQDWPQERLFFYTPR